jgi:hypothetical protein
MGTSQSREEAARPLRWDRKELCYRASQRPRVAEIKNVSVTLQRDEPSARNPRREFAPRFERDHPIVAIMDDQVGTLTLGSKSRTSML